MSYEEHHVADVLVMELTAMEPDAERFDAKMTVLMEKAKKKAPRSPMAPSALKRAVDAVIA